MNHKIGLGYLSLIAMCFESGRSIKVAAILHCGTDFEVLISWCSCALLNTDKGEIVLFLFSFLK